VKPKTSARCRVGLAALVAGALMLPFWAGGSEPPDLSAGGSFLSFDIDHSPAQEMLGTMAKKGLIEIKGAVPGGEPLSFHFDHLTLEQVLAKIMKGYNYVLVEQGKNRPPLLTIMGRVSRGASGPQKAPEPPPQSDAQMAEAGSYVPPQPPEVPRDKNGKPLPHWTDDEGKVHAVTDPTPAERTASGGQGSGQQAVQEPSGRTPATPQPTGEASAQGPSGVHF